MALRVHVIITRTVCANSTQYDTYSAVFNALWDRTMQVLNIRHPR